MIITDQVIEEINEVWKVALSYSIRDYKILFQKAAKDGTSIKDSKIYIEVTKYIINSRHIYNLEFNPQQMQGGILLKLVSKTIPDIQFIYCRLLKETMLDSTKLCSFKYFLTSTCSSF